jgi:pimeloyl-ACP methyl ester carboxylesterase
METLVRGRSYSDPVAEGLDRSAQTWPVITMVLLGSALSLIIAAGSLDRPLILLAITAILTLAVSAAWLRSVTWPAIFWGACGLTAGLAVGVRWLMIDGASPSAVAGLIALASGVAVVVASIARMSQRRPAWARALIILSVTLGLAVFVWTFSPAIIATDVPPIARGESSPSDLGLSAEEARFQTADGAQIAAWYIPATDGKTVILRHGSGETAASVLPHAAVLVRHGFGVLLADARGHGSSAGEAMDFGWYGDSDIAAALDYLSTRPEVDMEKVAVVGLSMGGEEAIGAIGADHRIAAVIAEGATARTDLDKGWLREVYGARGWIQLKLEWLQYAFTDLLTAAPKPPILADAAQAGQPRPVLLIAGGDMPDEINAAEFIAREAGAHVSIWVVPGAGHIQGLSTAPESWERTVISFLDTAMGE